jgi:hypothetical protein
MVGAIQTSLKCMSYRLKYFSIVSPCYLRTLYYLSTALLQTQVYRYNTTIWPHVQVVLRAEAANMV